MIITLDLNKWCGSSRPHGPHSYLFGNGMAHCGGWAAPGGWP